MVGWSIFLLLFVSVPPFLSYGHQTKGKQTFTDGMAKGAIALNCLEALATVILFKSSHAPFALLFAGCMWASQLYYMIKAALMVGRPLVVTKKGQRVTLLWAIWHIAFVLILAYA